MASLGEWDLDLRRIKMQIEAIEIGNYRLFRQAKLTDFPRLSVMIGPNGSGKSTLFDVFTFLKDALAQNVVRAVNRRGGFKELVLERTDFVTVRPGFTPFGRVLQASDESGQAAFDFDFGRGCPKRLGVQMREDQSGFGAEW